MTEWDHGHDGHGDGHGDGPDLPDHEPLHEPGVEPFHDALGADPGHLDGPAAGDPYGSPADPGHHPDPAAAEPAGLPEEQPADWSHLPPEVLHPGSSSWEEQHDMFGGAGEDAPDGTDPAGWTEAAGADPFPPALDMDVQPGDGGPWVDPALLGAADHWTAEAPGPELVTPVDPPAALLPDLAAADGDPGADWAALRDSDDPAVRALAQHWNP